jgi:hypothetical protein
MMFAMGAGTQADVLEEHALYGNTPMPRSSINRHSGLLRSSSRKMRARLGRLRPYGAESNALLQDYDAQGSASGANTPLSSRSRTSLVSGVAPVSHAGASSHLREEQAAMSPLSRQDSYRSDLTQAPPPPPMALPTSPRAFAGIPHGAGGFQYEVRAGMAAIGPAFEFGGLICGCLHRGGVGCHCSWNSTRARCVTPGWASGN